MDAVAIWNWMLLVGTIIGNGIAWLKPGLETAKSVQEVIKANNELAEKKDDDKLTPEKVRANAEMVRSLAWVGIIEYLVWLTKVILFSLPILLYFIVIFRWWDRKLSGAKAP